LGLIEKTRKDGAVRYFLTDEGNALFRLKYKARQLKFVEYIFRHRVFHACFRLYVKRLKIPERHEIVALMKTSHLYHVSAESTFTRRASTISSWIDWIAHLPTQAIQLEMSL
jgi:hypothetical protein